MDSKNNNEPSHVCNFCKSKDLLEIIDFGQMPASNHYLQPNNSKFLFKHRLAVDICNHCGLMQITDPIPREKLYLNYNFCFSAWKPHPHMQEEVELIKAVTTPDSSIFEIGSNDGVFLKQLEHAGFKDLNGIEPNHYAIEASRLISANLLCKFFDEQSTEEILSSHGEKFDVIVSRHCFEHIQNLHELMSCVNRIIKPRGWFLLEVPDFESHMCLGDCSAVWEEHIYYFTEPFLKSFLHYYGYSIKLIKRYGFSGVAIMIWARKLPEHATIIQMENAEQHKIDLSLIKYYALSYKAQVNKTREQLVNILELNHQYGKANVLYGAGNPSNMIINGLKTSEYFDAIVDDQPEKIGLYMPGYQFKIQSSDAIYQHIGSCFLSVNLENEPRVLTRHQAYQEAGGSFYSLRVPSPLFINKREIKYFFTAD